MRIVVLGAGGARKTEASIVRAARSLGHACRLVNVVGGRAMPAPGRSRIAQLSDRGFRARFPDFYPSCHRAGGQRLQGPSASRASSLLVFRSRTQGQGPAAGPAGGQDVRHLPRAGRIVSSGRASSRWSFCPRGWTRSGTSRPDSAPPRIPLRRVLCRLGQPPVTAMTCCER